MRLSSRATALILVLSGGAAIAAALHPSLIQRLLAGEEQAVLLVPAAVGALNLVLFTGIITLVYRTWRGDDQP